LDAARGRPFQDRLDPKRLARLAKNCDLLAGREAILDLAEIAQEPAIRGSM
jgi:hypothetical protein